MAEQLHSGHRGRMKAKFRKNGLSVFELHEIVEMLLYFGIPQKDTNPLAHRLCDRFGGLREILNADAEALSQVEGMTENAITLIRLVGDIRLYCGAESIPIGSLVTRTEDLVLFLQPRFEGRKTEALMLVSLDSIGTILNCTTLIEGTPTSADVSARAVVKQALSDGATRAVIAHNHPAGIACPSQADITTTELLVNALGMVGIALIDHIIFARDNDCISIAQTPSLKKVFQRK